VSDFISVKVIERPPSSEKITKNINFGIARGLTRLAKDGQSAVLGALRGKFTLRGTWFQQQNRFGIKIQPAKPNDLVAAVQTRADWLEKQETGGDKTSIQGHSIAVPTDQVRRNKRLIIPRGQRPPGLGSKAFVLQTKHGPVLAQRITRGKRKGIIILYGLERKVKIKKVDVFEKPIEKVVGRRGQRIIEQSIVEALATMK
jgi:hypothetical protein